MLSSYTVLHTCFALEKAKRILWYYSGGHILNGRRVFPMIDVPSHTFRVLSVKVRLFFLMASSHHPCGCVRCYLTRRVIACLDIVIQLLTICCSACLLAGEKTDRLISCPFRLAN
ncbi:hypothetical protein CRM22_001951 [Opisthorchis felineus]|uniref:Uncharacterized protein n=1 Tax=Opisthorchis felineus TaxID=147828 RepID=A0A4S2M8L6_OPIFE|nr:hypothetical protein CRM22_001951 [Opisthorchis felineus]